MDALARGTHREHPANTPAAAGHPARPRGAPGHGSAPAGAAARLSPLIPGETGAVAAVPAAMGTGTLAGDGTALQRCQLQAPIPDEEGGK